MSSKQLGAIQPNGILSRQWSKWALSTSIVIFGIVSIDFARNNIFDSVNVVNSVLRAKNQSEILSLIDDDITSEIQDKMINQSKSGDQTASPPKIVHYEDDGARIPSEKETAYYQVLRGNMILSDSSEGRDSDSITYNACCGLGHRSTKMGAAYHLSQLMNLTHMHAWWKDHCGGSNEFAEDNVFEHLFGKGPLIVEPPLWTNEIRQKIQQNLIPNNSLVQKFLSFHENASNFPEYFSNEVEGFQCGIESTVNNNFFGKHLSDAQLFHQLRALFRYNQKARNFLSSNDLLYSPLANGTILDDRKVMIGLHIRTGNGETIGFDTRGLHISLENWTANIATSITQLMDEKFPSRYAALLVTTDSPKPVAMIKEAIKSEYIQVISYEQEEQIPEGEGTISNFGSSKEAQDMCRKNYVDQFMDSTLLSSSDVVIAAAYSTFSQTIPLSSIFLESMVEESRQMEHRNGYYRLFCEMGTKGDVMGCFDNYMTWARTYWDDGKSALIHIMDHKLAEKGVQFFGNFSSPMMAHWKPLNSFPCG